MAEGLASVDLNEEDRDCGKFRVEERGLGREKEVWVRKEWRERIRLG